MLNPYSFRAAALAGSACAGSASTLDGSAVTHPSNASGSSALGEGGSMIVVADRFSAGCGLLCLAKGPGRAAAQRHENSQNCHPTLQENSPILWARVQFLEPRPNLQGTRLRRAAAARMPYLILDN